MSDKQALRDAAAASFAGHTQGPFPRLYHEKMAALGFEIVHDQRPLARFREKPDAEIFLSAKNPKIGLEASWAENAELRRKLDEQDAKVTLLREGLHEAACHLKAAGEALDSHDMLPGFASTLAGASSDAYSLLATAGEGGAA